MTKVIGKPYAGKPHVRIDEGVTEQIYVVYLLCALLYWQNFLDANAKCTKEHSFNSFRTNKGVFLPIKKH
jgi:hypothetical protein